MILKLCTVRKKTLWKNNSFSIVLKKKISVFILFEPGTDQNAEIRRNSNKTLIKRPVVKRIQTERV